MPYRKDIDGLRALAILGVLLFHSGITGLKGGFLGVDVFFVISGYLLGSMIITGMQGGTFSLPDFYFRRAKRIIPALAVVVAISILIAWKLLLPHQLEDFAHSLVGIALFIPNIWFWKQTGYFSTNNEEKPLIHTWSLGVEEQFYVLFPLLLILMDKANKRLKWGTLLLIFGASLSVAHWGSTKMPSANFYLLPSRIWEFGLGVLVFLSEKRVKGSQPIRVTRWAREVVTLISLCSLVGSMFLFSERTPHPSLLSLIPTVSTALLILFGDKNLFVSSLLRSKPLVAIGLISYSLYLWHQPTFAFLRIRFPEESLYFHIIVGFNLVFLLSLITWYFVEQPFRQITRSKWWVAQLAGLSSVLIVIGMVGIRNQGFPTRMNNFSDVSKQVQTEPTEKISVVESTADIFRVGDLTRPSDLVFLGDSHVQYLSQALSSHLRHNRTSAIVITESFCAPLVQFGTDSSERNARCRISMTQAIDWVLAQNQIKTVVLFAEWALYTEGYRWTTPQPVAYSDDVSPNQNVEKNPEVFLRALIKTVQRIRSAGKELIIVKGVPEFQIDIMNHFQQATLWESSPELPQHKSLRRSQFLIRNANVEKAFSQIKDEQVLFVESGEVFCPLDKCDYLSSDRKPLYADDNHLSYIGSKRLVDLFWSVFTNRNSSRTARPETNRAPITSAN